MTNRPRLLVTGDRFWNTWAQFELIERVIREIGPGTIIHGGAAGVDQMANMVACKINVHRAAYPAKWGTYGQSAGMIRNSEMLREGKPTIVCAFHDDLWRKSKGTRHMVTIAKQAHIPVRVFTSAGEA